MDDKVQIKMYAFTIDCPQPYELAQFYAKMLKWDIVFHDEAWACIGVPGKNQGAYPGILFQRNEDYIPPVWPDREQAQQQMAHMDFAVNHLEEAVAYALACGATIAEAQFSDQWRLMIDPAGHPFCLCQMKQIFERAEFALL